MPFVLLGGWGQTFCVFARDAWQKRRQQRGAWLAELRAIADEVSARATLSDDEATDLIDEAVRETAERPQPATP